MASIHSAQGYIEKYSQMEDYPGVSNRVFNGDVNLLYKETSLERFKSGKLSLLEMLKANKNLSVFYNLVNSSKYKDLLNDSKSGVTLFAPTNRAFKRLEESAYDEMMGVSVDEFIAYHIAKNRIVLADISGRRFYTPTYHSYNLLLNGMAFSPKIGRRFQRLTSIPRPNQDASVIEGDFEASNGVLHAIDDILLQD